MASWPTEIKITRNSYSETPPDRVVRSNMDVGPAKVRRRSSANVRNIGLKLFLTEEQLDILDAFYLDNDAAVFDFPNPRTGDSDRARFTGAPSYDLNETMFDVSVRLEILP